MSTQKLQPFSVAVWLWMSSLSSSSSGSAFSRPQYTPSWAGIACGMRLKITDKGVSDLPNCRRSMRVRNRMTMPPGASMGVMRMELSSRVVIAAAEAVVQQRERGEQGAEQDAEGDADGRPHRSLACERAATAVRIASRRAGA